MLCLQPGWALEPSSSDCPQVMAPPAPRGHSHPLKPQVPSIPSDRDSSVLRSLRESRPDHVRGRGAAPTSAAAAHTRITSSQSRKGAGMTGSGIYVRSLDPATTVLPNASPGSVSPVGGHSPPPWPALMSGESTDPTPLPVRSPSGPTGDISDAPPGTSLFCPRFHRARFTSDRLSIELGMRTECVRC